MPSPLAATPWEGCLLQPAHDPAVEAYARRITGLPHPGVRYFARAPWVARMTVRWLPEHGLLVETDLHLADLVGLVVSQENSCRFCYAAVRALLRIQGMSETRIRMLEQQLARLEVEPRLAAAVRFARALSRSNPAPGPADRQGLAAAGYSAGAMRELAFVTCAMVMLNRTATLAALPPRTLERAPDLLPVRWLRPLLARWVGARRRPGRRAPAPPYAGPFAGLIAAFGDAPVAAVLGTTLQEMDASTGLPGRTRWLLLAVIARGLGCAASEAEARGQLARHGLAGDRVEAMLAHFDAGALDDTERALLPLARETLWYDPARLQQSVRAVATRVTPPELTEAIGVMALGNALCRLQMAAAAIGP